MRRTVLSLATCLLVGPALAVQTYSFSIDGTKTSYEPWISNVGRTTPYHDLLVFQVQDTADGTYSVFDGGLQVVRPWLYDLGRSSFATVRNGHLTYFDFWTYNYEFPYWITGNETGGRFYMADIVVQNRGGPWYEVNATLTPVPEPGTYALMLAGLGVVVLLGRRHKRSSSRIKEPRIV